MRATILVTERIIDCLNPYSTGRYSVRGIYVKVTAPSGVLILILLEDTL